MTVQDERTLRLPSYQQFLGNYSNVFKSMAFAIESTTLIPHIATKVATQANLGTRVQDPPSASARGLPQHARIETHCQSPRIIAAGDFARPTKYLALDRFVHE